MSECEYLVKPTGYIGSLAWETGTPGNIPCGAVTGGWSSDGTDILYMLVVYMVHIRELALTVQLTSVITRKWELLLYALQVLPFWYIETVYDILLYSAIYSLYQNIVFVMSLIHM